LMVARSLFQQHVEIQRQRYVSNGFGRNRSAAITTLRRLPEGDSIGWRPQARSPSRPRLAAFHKRPRCPPDVAPGLGLSHGRPRQRGGGIGLVLQGGESLRRA
jgi:hypothetical protein